MSSYNSNLNNSSLEFKSNSIKQNGFLGNFLSWTSASPPPSPVYCHFSVSFILEQIQSLATAIAWNVSQSPHWDSIY